MTVFELQVDPERNAVIRHALAKRIVHQRELDEEEASTEEDESFLGSSIAIARQASLSVAGPRPRALLRKDKRHSHHERQRASSRDSLTSATDSGNGLGPGSMSFKSRWKSEYRTATSSSPSGSFISAISEILPELLPEILPEIMLKNDSSTFASSTRQDVTATRLSDQTTAIATTETETETVLIQTATRTVGGAVETGPTARQITPPTKISTSGIVAEHEPENGYEPLDSVEQDLMIKLQELRTEKTRLFTLFRASLMRKEAQEIGSPTPGPLTEVFSETTSTLAEDTPTPAHASANANTPSQNETITDVAAATSALASASETVAASEFTPNMNENSHPAMDTEYIKDEPNRSGGSRKPSDHDSDRRTESPRPGYKRREHERTIDRSKLNLEIPRKPSLSSASSNSSASTPTPTSTAFTIHHHSHHHPYQHPPLSASSTNSGMSTHFPHKGKRHRSISPSLPDGPSGRSGAGIFGHSGTYPDATSPSNKYPRADYMGSHGRSSSSNGSNGGYSGLPDRPPTRHHHSSSTSSPGGRGSGDGYHGDDGYYRTKSGGGGGGPFSSLMNGGNTSYRHGGPPGYQPPPTRIGFGNSGGSSSRSGGGYHGAGGDGMPVSKLTPPTGGRMMPFSRNMMPLQHARGLMHGGGGGGGGGRPGFGGGGGRPGDWSRRRSRV